jgi:hypothetical protein
LGLTAGGSPRVSLGFTINERRPPRVTTHQEDGSTNTLFGMWLSGKQGRSGALDLGRAFGRAFTASFSGSATSTTCRREHVWDPDLCRSSLVNSGTVVFTPVAWVRDRRTGARAPGPPSEERTPERTRWQVDVIGTDHWSWGVRQGLRAGVDVDWLHRTVLELKDGVIASARGKVSLRAVRGFSEPSGLFSVTVRKRQTGPEYPLPAASKPKGSRRTTLVFYDRSRAARSEYLLRYAIALTGPQALAVMRSAGVPDPDATYRTLSERGAVIDSVAPSVPDPGRLVFLLEAGRQHRPTAFFDQSVRCPQGVVDQTCFVNRGGQFVIVTKLG